MSFSKPTTDIWVYTCCAVHVVKASNRKGNHQCMENLEEIAEILDSKWFHVIGEAFDRDFYVNRFHAQFQQHWTIQTINKTTRDISFGRMAR
jgi:hypothetical protein